MYCFIFFFIGKQKISFRRPGHSCYFQYIEFLQLFYFCSLFLKKKNLYFQKTNLIKTVDQSFSFPSGGFAIIKQKSHRPNASIWGWKSILVGISFDGGVIGGGGGKGGGGYGTPRFIEGIKSIFYAWREGGPWGTTINGLFVINASLHRNSWSTLSDTLSRGQDNQWKAINSMCRCISWTTFFAIDV